MMWRELVCPFYKGITWLLVGPKPVINLLGSCIGHFLIFDGRIEWDGHKNICFTTGITKHYPLVTCSSSLLPDASPIAISVDCRAVGLKCQHSPMKATLLVAITNFS